MTAQTSMGLIISGVSMFAFGMMARIASQKQARRIAARICIIHGVPTSDRLRNLQNIAVRRPHNN